MAKKPRRKTVGGKEREKEKKKKKKKKKKRIKSAVDYLEGV